MMYWLDTTAKEYYRKGKKEEENTANNRNRERSPAKTRLPSLEAQVVGIFRSSVSSQIDHKKYST